LAASPLQRAGITLLPSSHRVEDRAVELDATLMHRNNPGLRGREVGVAAKQQLGGHRMAPGGALSVILASRANASIWAVTRDRGMCSPRSARLPQLAEAARELRSKRIVLVHEVDIGPDQ